MIGGTLLLRQAHPTFVHNDFPSSQAFRPMPKDEFQLSFYDGDLITAEKAFRHYTTQLKFESAGTVALTVEECSLEQLPARPDPAPFPEHAIVDFTGLTDAECRKKAKKLQAKALSRGWLHRAHSET